MTGGATGIGQGIALALAAGANIAVTTHSNDARETEEMVGQLGRRFLTVKKDLSTLEAAGMNALLDEVETEVGVVDILVNNAGMIRRNDADRYNDEDWDSVLELNLNSVWRLSRAAGQRMLSRGYGRSFRLPVCCRFRAAFACLYIPPASTRSRA